MSLSKEILAYVKAFIDRYAWSHWPAKQEALVEARQSRGKYLCADCGELFGPREVNADHIHARVDPKRGWVSLDEYVARTLVPADKLQILCRPCHRRKSTAENKIRAATRRRNK